ncbi:CYFA0S02e11012g1_1 [Cyberlindnera fabianii]|uniref:CYFA0S02e11012g1_1 n=1 Tax=Cyberlindnera fabianii TaxID=36022 RepID=A0A061APG7_CYBFA|nr:CYFA0S02e11012g1_1 [Cyberlindnera fabianii]
MAEDQPSKVTSPSRYSKATHLTEFYPYLNGGTLSQPYTTTNETSQQYPASGLHSRKQSLSSYTSFTPSTLDFRSLVTKTEISHTSESFEELLAASDKYRRALLLVAEAAGDFGAALEKTAKCKGAGSAADGLLNAGGLFFLVANHQQLLAHSVGETFEKPVRQQVGKFKEQSMKNDESFKTEIKDRVKELKQQEKENAKLSKSKTRNLVAYRTKLMQLTSHIDEIDKLKHEYYQSAFDLVQDTSNNVLMQVGSVVRAQVEIYEGIARKGWSGGGLDELIAQCPDPFTIADDEDDDEDEEAVNEDESQKNNENAHQSIHASSTSSTHTSNSTIKKESEVRADDHGLSFNRGVFATKPILSHQQSIQTFKTSDPLIASTPIMMSPKSSNREDEQDRTITMDDNSFSLPVPGSARVKKEDNQSQKSSVGADVLNGGIIENTEEANAGEDEEEAEGKGSEEEEEKREGLAPSAKLDHLPVQNEWRDDGDSEDGG